MTSTFRNCFSSAWIYILCITNIFWLTVSLTHIYNKYLTWFFINIYPHKRMCPRLTGDLCSRLFSMDAPLARRDWLEFMVGVAAVCVMTGSGGGGGGGMEAFGFRIPLGLSIMAWIFSSAHTHTEYLMSKNDSHLLYFGICNIFMISVWIRAALTMAVSAAYTLYMSRSRWLAGKALWIFRFLRWILCMSCGADKLTALKVVQLTSGSHGLAKTDQPKINPPFVCVLLWLWQQLVTK